MPSKNYQDQSNTFLIKGCALLIVFFVLAGSFYLLYYLYKKDYETKKQNIIREISSIKPFSPQDAAGEKGWTYPPSEPQKTPEQIKKEINDFVLQQINAVYPKKELSEKKAEIIKKYRAAKIGEKIRFQTNTSKDFIEGIYQGREGRTIKVNDKQYKLFDIFEEYKYLFDETLAEKICTDKLKEFEDEWQKKVNELSQTIEKNETEKRFSEAGYIKSADSTWKHESEIVKDYVEKKRKQYKEEKQNTINQIINKNRIFGMIKLPQEELDKILSEIEKQNPNE